MIENNEDDILGRYLENNFSTEKVEQPKQQNVVSTNNVKELGYLNVDINSLPLGQFYPAGIKIKIRSANVAEIQAFSIVDDRNILDVTEKINQLLSVCVRVTFADGTIGSYKDVKDGDKMYLIFMIRELTFQQGPSLSKKVECEHCTHEFNILYRTTSNNQYPKTITSYDMPENLNKYFSNKLKCYTFNIDGVEYKLAPPTIGIQECFFSDLRKKAEQNSKKTPNVSQMKLLQFLLWDKNYISEEGIRKKEDEIKKMDMKTFQILNSAVDKMKVGLNELVQKCPNCGGEVHSEITFPNGISSIFIIPDFFDEFNR